MIVKTVISGKEAIAACEKERFDIIFLDHMMPEMDGIETLKQLRKMQKREWSGIYYCCIYGKCSQWSKENVYGGRF